MPPDPAGVESAAVARNGPSAAEHAAAHSPLHPALLLAATLVVGYGRRLQPQRNAAAGDAAPTEQPTPHAPAPDHQRTGAADPYAMQYQ